MISVSFELEKEQVQFLDFYCRTFKIDKSELIRELIAQLMERHEAIWRYEKSANKASRP